MTMEHRGLIGAFGVGLVLTGITGGFAYGTAAYARGHEFDWGSGYVNTAEAVLFTGVALLALTAFLIVRARNRLREIGNFVLEGSKIRAVLELAVTMKNTSGIKKVIQDSQEWEREVLAWFHKHLPPYESVFLNRGDMPTLQELHERRLGRDEDVSLYARDAILATHLRRLSEIQMKL